MSTPAFGESTEVASPASGPGGFVLGAAAEALNARVERYEQQDGVHSTPTFVINGKMLDPATAPTLANLDAAIAAARAAR